MEKMNVYQKLNEARRLLREVEMKKSGYNSFSKYDYFELGDFLGPIMEINEQLNVTTLVTFPDDRAMLHFVDNDTKNTIVFDSPMGKASLKAAHDVQNLGACHTYMRRYMYILAYEIVEHDAVDASDGLPDLDEGTEKQFSEAIKACNTIDSLLKIHEEITTKYKPNNSLIKQLGMRKTDIIQKGN